jgi:hypothetical protein
MNYLTSILFRDSHCEPGPLTVKMRNALELNS